MSVKKPHILLAATNPLAMLENIRHVVGNDAVRQIQKEIDKNVRELFALGNEHLTFSKQIPNRSWRQKISRLYYGAFNARRAIVLHFSGDYHTDVSDHKNVGKLPDSFPNKETYSIQLRDLREDRNLADYDHSATVDDLLRPLEESERIVDQFISDARSFLENRGVRI